MPANRRRRKFTLVEIDPFDARHGYRRCSIPGVGLTMPVDPTRLYPPIQVTADFWWNKAGGLVVRFSSNQPNVFHFEAMLGSGKPVPESCLPEFVEYVEDVLADWGAVDDPPDPHPPG